MDGQDGGGGQRKKAHGKSDQRRGSILKGIIRDWTGSGGETKSPDGSRRGGNDGGDNGNGGGGDATSGANVADH
uniref:Uncharacterized protein n=1 Tax=Arundo donax TaxID=35708 RepID=A0A0A9A4D9_ARUDO